MTTATATRTDPGKNLQKEEQSSITSTRHQPGSTENEDRQRSALRPPVDVIEDASGITLFADLPGVAKDKLSLKLEGDQLIIEGEMSLNIPEQMSASHAELQLAHFRRSFALSKELDPDNIQAECRQGVLKLRIPKAKHAQPRKIPISVN